MGETHPIYGRVVMMGITGGERYYWWFEKGRDIAMMPASMFASEEP